MSFFYLSFATDEAFLGATVVVSDTPVGAVKRTHELGLNPGGEVMILELDAALETNPAVSQLLNRLVGETEIVEQMGGVKIGDVEMPE